MATDRVAMIMMIWVWVWEVVFFYSRYVDKDGLLFLFHRNAKNKSTINSKVVF